MNDKQLKMRDKAIIVASGLALGVCGVTAIIAAPIELAATAVAAVVGGVAIKQCYKDDNND